MRSVKPFHYIADVSDEDFTAGEISVHGRTDDYLARPPLAGVKPTIRFFGDQMLLVSDPAKPSEVKWRSFLVGDVVIRTVRAGDRIETTRNGLGGVTVCVFRSGRLVVAAGALSGARLGLGVSIRSTGLDYPDRRYQIDVDGERCILGMRQAATLGIYDFYVDFSARGSRYEVESISVAPFDDPATVHSARRSAVLMALQDLDRLYGEHSDGRMIKFGHGTW
jgi:hypothetical protein